jgi:hypothetical protein
LIQTGIKRYQRMESLNSQPEFQKEIIRLEKARFQTLINIRTIDQQQLMDLNNLLTNLEVETIKLKA